MHQGVRLLLTLHCLLCPAAAISRQELFHFGGHWGDQLLPQGDDETSEGVKLSKVLPFYEAEFGSLYVGTNGLISTQDFPRETQYVDDGFPTDFPAIAPFLSDIDTSQGKGKIFYRQDTTEGILGRAAQEVRRGFPQAAFHPTNVFLATWENVGAYEEVTQLSGPSNQFNTFQAVIAYDDADAYAVFLYPQDGIQFFGTRPKESYNVHLHLPARVGFCRGESDFLKREGPFYSITSSEQSVKDLYQKSNVHIPGVWVFHIGSISQMDNVVPAGVVGKPFLEQQVLMPETVVNNEGDEVYSDLSNENSNYPETFLYEEEEVDYPLAGPTDRPPRLHAEHPDHVDPYESKHGYSSLPQHNEAKQSTFVEPHSNPAFSEVFRRGDTPQVEGGNVFAEDDEEYNEPAVRDYVLATATANLPPYNENGPSYPDGAAAPSEIEIIPVHSEGETLLPPSSHGRPAADDDFNVRVESDVFTYRAARKDTCEGSQGQCSQHAYCRDYTYGFCCHCQSEYYGNGRYCLPKGAPHRVNGKVTGRILVDGSMVEFADVDLHAYIVLNDGRAYTAISHIPTLAARALMPLSPIGGLFGWLFALEKPGFENGFSIVGAKFTHNIDVTFYPGEERIHVTQVANGLDAHNYLNVKTTIKGQLPFMPEDSTIQMEPYSELYHYSGSAITSTTRREYSVVSGSGESVKYFYRLHQNVTYEDCAHDERVPPATQKLNVDRVFVFYSKEERVLRYAMTNHIGSVQDPVTTDPTQVNPCYDRTHECHFTARCQPGVGLDYSCECSTGFQGTGRDCTDVDECATGIHRCGPFSVCLNLPGRYQCECQDGYQLQSDGYTCAPVSSGSNPCEDGRHNCAPSHIAQCISHAVGTFRCVCLPGFTGDGRNCTDIDECAQGRCHANAACYNSPGSFTCRCRPGYDGDGFQCALRPGPIKTLCQQQREELEASFAPRSHRPIVGVNLPQCDSAGEFLPQQCHSSTGECWCVDKSGREISGTRTRPGTTPRNCDIPAPTQRPQTVCERWRQSLLEHYGGTPTAEQYIPQCDTYGNFSPLQCHGNSGYCWCVDKDGREVPGTRKEPGMTPACIPTVAPPTMRPTPRPDVTPPAEGTFLLYAQGQQIGVLPLNGTKLNKATAKTLLSLHGSIVVGIDYDCKARMVYWTDVAGRTISRAKIEPGAEPEIIINTGLMSPEGIAIDYHRRAMFWTDSGLDRIETASLDGTERKVLFDTDLVNPRAITVDSVRGHLYWTDWNREAPKIETSYVDGSNRRILVNDDIGLPNGLAYDPFSKQICWGDAGTKKLECMHPNGTGRRVVQSNLNYPFSVVCYANHIYLTDWRRDGVVSVSKDSGTITEEYLPEQRSHLYGITAVHRYCPSGRK